MIRSLKVRNIIRGTGWLRFLVIMVAIAALLGVAAGSVTPAHLHAKAPAGGSCDICFAAHLASPEAASLASVLPAPETEGNVSVCETCAGYQLIHSTSFSTRGPPSTQL
jgi:hypothetical protein